MAGKGFKRIYNLSGGIKGWHNETAIGPADLGLELFKGKETGEQAIIIGYGLENGLREFYLEMAGQVTTTSKELFTKLADIEIIHQKQLLDLYTKLTGQPITMADFSTNQVKPAMEGGLSTAEYLKIFNPDLEKEEDILSLAMSIEAQALDLYERAADQAPTDEVKKVLKKIAQEERNHIALLAQYIDTMAG